MNTQAIAKTTSNTNVYPPENAVDIQESAKLQITVNLEGQGKLLNRRLDIPTQGTKEAQTRRKHWESTHIPSMHIKDSRKKILSEREVSIKLNTYSPNQLPWPAPHHSYCKDEHGALMPMKHENYNEGASMIMYEANPNATPQYITQKNLNTATEPLHHLEAFATADHKGINQNLRKIYPIRTYQACRGFPQDRGHGIDFILTMPEDKHSSIESSNFTPQNSIYNRQVRRLLVQRLIDEEDASFKEINIYGPKPDTLTQKIAGKYTTSGKVETHSIDVPEGFLFIAYSSSKKISNVYYFPNFIDYNQVKECYEIDYTQIPAVFEIEIPTELLWGKEINLFGVNIYEPSKPEDEISKEAHVKSYVGFRMLSGLYKITYKGESEWIPVEAVQALKRTLVLKNLNEMAETEFSSVEYKLALVKTLLSKLIYVELGQTLYDPLSALSWLRRVKEQVANESTLKEKIELHDFYEFLEVEHPEIYNALDNNIKNQETSLLKEIIIQERDEGGSIEEKLQICSRLEKKNHKLFYLEKIEAHIMKSLNSSDLDERTIAIEELHNLADSYSQFLGQVYYNIPLNYQKAHELYQLFFENYSNYFHNGDAPLYIEHLKKMLIESPESIEYKHMMTYARFFRNRSYTSVANFWETRANRLHEVKGKIK